MEKPFLKKFKTNFNDLDYFKEVPEILYKYRNYDNKYHNLVLTEKKIYFPSAKYFNDPFDCSLPFQIYNDELSEENLFLKCFEFIRRINPTLTDSQIHQICFNNKIITKLKNSAEISKNIQEVSFSKFGILSLSTNNDNFLMWSHYANSHTGFVIGFDSKKLFNSLPLGVYISPIFYQKEVPSFSIFEEEELLKFKLLLTKADYWQYENEFRIISEKIINSNYIFDSDVVKSIILGSKMNFKHRMEIINLVKKDFPFAKIFDAKLDSKIFKLNLEQIY